MKTISVMKCFNLKKRSSIVLFVLVLSFCNCSSNKRSDEFINYINNDLKDKINTQDSKYLVLSLYSCQDCLIKTREILTNLDTEENYIYLVVAANSKKEINQFFSLLQKNKSIMIVYDTNMILINKGFYSDGGNKFYQYLDGKLISSFSFDSKNNFDKLKEILIQ